ncbi:MAG: thiamine pyrophosphate-binding protein [Steroidobacteraceae bacterium]
MSAGNEQRTGADLFLEILRNFGVEYIFSSPGTEWAPLWESLAKQKALGMTGPQYLCARHEDIAIGMASGYSKATGKLSVCLIHSSVGSLRAAMCVRGAYQAQVPMLVCAGESLTFGEGAPWVGFHWGRYLEDYGGPARLMEPVVKSSFCVHDAALLGGSVHRACNLAMASAPGPVFLSIPFEVSAAPAVGTAPAATRHPLSPDANAAGLAEVAALLEGSRKPLIITERLGRRPAAVADLVKLAEAVGAVVIEAQHPEYVNFPRDHDLHGGFNAKPFLQDADTILLLDMVGPPWYPETALRPPGARIVTIGDDPLRGRFPYHGVDGDLVLVGDAPGAVATLARTVGGNATVARARREELRASNRGRRAEWHDMAQRQARAEPIDSRWMCEVLNEHLPDDAILVDETIIQNFTMLNVMDRLRPGQYVNAMDGGLGTGLGAALGVKTAEQGRPVVVILGDGAFNYNAPLAALGFCQEYGMPITIIIGNNRRYLAMQMPVKLMYPGGWAARTNQYYGAYLQPDIDYADMARLVGGYGERVTDPSGIRDALDRALQANREGRPAILNVIIGDELEYLGPMMKDEH